VGRGKNNPPTPPLPSEKEQGKAKSAGPSTVPKVDFKSLFVARGGHTKPLAPKTVTVESVVKEAVRKGAEAIPLPPRSTLLCGCTTAPFTDLLAYANHLHGGQHTAFVEAIGEQERSFAPKECVFCDTTLRNKAAWDSHIRSPQHLASERWGKTLLSLSWTENVCEELEHPIRPRGKRKFEDICGELKATSQSIKENPLVRYSSTIVSLTDYDEPTEEKPVDTPKDSQDQSKSDS